MLGVPSAHLLEIGALGNAAGGLHAEAVNHQSGGDDTGHAERDGAGLNHEVADTQVAMALVERSVDLDPVLTRILGVGLAATDAGGACLDAPAATMVVANDAAVGLGLRTAATQRIEAVALGLFRRTELIDELAILEVAATLAVVMHGLAEESERACSRR